MTKTQKKELKARLFKILHGICYVLSAIFVLVLVVASVKGCSPKKQRNNTSQVLAPQQLINNSQSQKVYQFKYSTDSSVYIPFDVQSEYLIDYPIGTYSINVDIQDVSLDQYVNLEFEVVDFGSSIGVGLGYVNLVNSNNVTSQIIDYNGDENALYNTYYIDVLFLNNASFYNSVFDLLFEEVSGYNFVFNKEFNYNSPMNCDINTPYYSRPSGLLPTGGSVLVYLEYDTGYFISNGQVFNKIRWYWNATLGANYFDFNNKGNIDKGPLGEEQGFYLKLSYYNSDTTTLVDVNNRNQIAFMPTASSYAYYWTNSSTWVNDEYRYIKFIEDLSDSVRVSVNSFNNNNQYSGGFSGGDNVFTLIGTAFTGILPILGIMILPNITLGMLLFVPLVAILVFAIIRVIKK